MFSYLAPKHDSSLHHLQQSAPRSSWQSSLGLKKAFHSSVGWFLPHFTRSRNKIKKVKCSFLLQSAAFIELSYSHEILLKHTVAVVSPSAVIVIIRMCTWWYLFMQLHSFCAAALCVGRRLLCSEGTVKLCDQHKVNLTHITGTSIVTHQNSLILTTFLSLKGHRV